MKTIKGEYENGSIKLPEDVPTVSGNKVLITFLDDKEYENTVFRDISLQYPSSFNGYLKDEREDIYQKFLNSGK